jgi:hypothetical protein
MASRARVAARTSGNTERDAVRGRRGAVDWVDHLDERTPFDEHLITALHVSVGRLEIKDDIGCSVGARRKPGVVQTTFRVNSLTP